MSHEGPIIIRIIVAAVVGLLDDGIIRQHQGTRDFWIPLAHPEL